MDSALVNIGGAINLAISPLAPNLKTLPGSNAAITRFEFASLSAPLSITLVIGLGWDARLCPGIPLSESRCADGAEKKAAAVTTAKTTNIPERANLGERCPPGLVL